MERLFFIVGHPIETSGLRRELYLRRDGVNDAPRELTKNLVASVSCCKRLGNSRLHLCELSRIHFKTRPTFANRGNRSPQRWKSHSKDSSRLSRRIPEETPRHRSHVSNLMEYPRSFSARPAGETTADPGKSLPTDLDMRSALRARTLLGGASFSADINSLDRIETDQTLPPFPRVS